MSLACEVGEAPGLWIEEGRLRVVLPRPYGGCLPSGDALERCALRLLAVLQRYQDEGRRAVEGVEVDAVHRFGRGTGDALDRLEAGLLLLQDWQALGPVPFTESRPVERKPGRIDWERTRRRFPPTEDRGSMVFPHLLLRRVESRWDHPVQQLHRYTLRGLQIRLRGQSEIADEKIADEPLRLLDRWEARCFTDRQRRVAVLLRRYHGAEGGEGKEGSLSGIVANKFEHVWERMLRVALGGRRPAPHRAAYQLATGEERPGLHLQPDFVLREQDRAYLADAKDYALANLPLSTDIAKQLAYFWLRIGCEAVPADQLQSLFLLPGLGRPCLLQARMPLGRLSCVRVDLERVQNAYLAGRSDVDLRRHLFEVTR